MANEYVYISNITQGTTHHHPFTVLPDDNYLFDTFIFESEAKAINRDLQIETILKEEHDKFI